MQRIFMVVTVALLMAALMLATAMPVLASAQKLNCNGFFQEEVEEQLEDLDCQATVNNNNVNGNFHADVPERG